MQSENAEMYLVTLALLEEQGAPMPISIPRLAEELEVQVVSANQMIRKLEEKGLVNYRPYKGVSFSAQGAEHARDFLRHRRLWETFFVDHLGYSPSEADSLACRMEHITEPKIAERLSQFLDHPKATPTGKTIPQPGEGAQQHNHLPLTALHAGQEAEVVEVNTDQATSRYLDGQGLHPGVMISINAVSGSHTWLISTGDRSISLSAEIAAAITVSKLEDD